MGKREKWAKWVVFAGIGLDDFPHGFLFWALRRRRTSSISLVGVELSSLVGEEWIEERENKKKGHFQLSYSKTRALYIFSSATVLTFCYSNFQFLVVSKRTLRRLLAAKFFSSSTRWRSRRCLVTKPNGIHTQQLLHKNNELGQKLHLWSQFAWTKFFSMLVQLANLLTTFKIILLYI